MESLTNRQRAQSLTEFEEWRQEHAPTSYPAQAVEAYLATLYAADLLQVLEDAAINLEATKPALAERLRAIANSGVSA